MNIAMLILSILSQIPNLVVSVENAFGAGAGDNKLSAVVLRPLRLPLRPELIHRKLKLFLISLPRQQTQLFRFSIV